MKFCEKLQKLRKEKGYSQEQLADLLDVSRQSVSKWESGTTYPEMDKLLSLCKIFDVTLDDLTNDEVTDKTIKEKSRNTLSNVIDAILDMISRSIEMFRSMDRKEIIKCITELLIVALILFILKFPFNFIDDLAINIFANFSREVYLVLTSIWLFLSNTIYLILFVTIFIYTYKIRFLDKFNYERTLKKSKEKEDNEHKEEVENSSTTHQEDKTPSVKPVKAKHSFVLFDVLGTLFNIFVKVCFLFVLIPIVIFFVFLVIATTIALIVQFLGIHYIGIFIALLGTTAASAIIMEFFIRVLVSSAIPIKRMFIIFLSGLIVLGIGGGITAFEISSTKYIDKIPENIEPTVVENTYDMNENLFFRPDLYIDAISYEVDENLTTEVNVKITYYEDYLKIDTYQDTDFYVISSYSTWNNTLNYLNLIKNNLKNKTLYNYELLGRVELTITSSSKNIEKIKENSQNYYEKLHENANEYYVYQEEIYNLQEELQETQNENAELREKVDELQSKLDNINNVIG